MSYGHLYLRKQIRYGYGLLFVERHVRLLQELLEIGARKHVEIYGTIFQMNIVKGTAFQIFGKHIRQSFQKVN